MSTRVQRCHCGHDKASHYADPTTGVRHDCLAMGCDCGAYVDEDRITNDGPLRYRHVKQLPPRHIYDDPRDAPSQYKPRYLGGYW